MTKLPPAVGHKDKDGNKYYTINEVRVDPDGKGNFTDGNRVGSLKSFKEQLMNYRPQEEQTEFENTKLVSLTGGKEYNPWDTVSPALFLKHMKDNFHCLPEGFEGILDNIFDAYGLSEESPEEIAEEFARQVEGVENRRAAKAEIGDKF
jgi:hypothetical protein